MKYDLPDYDELVLTHLLRSKKVFELAKELKITAEDFLSSHLLGNEIYKLIGESILAIDTSPINPGLLLVEIKTRAEEAFITDLDGGEVTADSDDIATISITIQADSFVQVF